MPATGYISQEHWEEFDRKFLAASAWLDHANLVGELAFLRRWSAAGLLDDPHEKSNPFRKRRLRELEELFAATDPSRRAAG